MLIVKMSSIGDVVQALPVASALRRHDPAARITWAIEHALAPLVAHHPAVDRVVHFPAMRWRSDVGVWWREFTAALRWLRAEPYDVAIDLQGLFKSAAVSFASRAPTRIGIAWLREGSRFVSRPVPHAERAHAVEEYLACAEALGAPGHPVSFRLAVEPSAAASVDRLLSLVGIGSERPLIAVNPSPSDAMKTWPAARWTELVDALAPLGRVLLIGTAEHGNRHAAIGGRARQKPYDLTGRTSLLELVALLDRAALHIAPDTGSGHIAAALGRPVIAIHGPTEPWRLAPWGQAEKVAYHADLCARTCPTVCPWRRRCLAAVHVDEVAKLARQVLMR